MGDEIQFNPTNKSIRWEFGDLYQITGKLSHYELGGISSIVNLIGGQYSEVKFVTEEESEISSFDSYSYDESEQVSHSETLSESVQNTIAKSSSSERSFGINAAVQANYGTVKASVGASFSSKNSESRSNQSTSQFARSVTDSSRKEISSQVVRQQTQNIRKLYREENTRGLDNRGGLSTAHIFRFVEEVHEHKLLKHAKHLFTKLILPFPAANYINALENGAVGKSTIDEAVQKLVYIDPQNDQKVEIIPSKITKDNWFDLCSYFGLSDPITPPKTISVTEIIKSSNTGNTRSVVETLELQIPENFQPIKLYVNDEVHVYKNDGRNDWKDFSYSFEIGRHKHVARWWTAQDQPPQSTNKGPFDIDIHEVKDGILKVGVFGLAFNYGLFSVEVVCQPTEEAFHLWQLQLFDQLVQAKGEKLTSGQSSMVEELDLVQVADLTGSPLAAQQMIKSELSRLALQFLTGSNLMGLDAVDRHTQPFPNFPTLDHGKINSLQAIYSFLDKIIDFEKMTYRFLNSYFGGNETRKNAYSSAETGELDQFLKAGAVELLLPVSSGWEKQLFFFLTTGAIFEGEDAPLPDNPEFLALYQEVLEHRDMTDSDVDAIEIDSWLESYLSSHLALQDGGILPDFRDPANLPKAVENQTITPKPE